MNAVAGLALLACLGGGAAAATSEYFSPQRGAFLTNGMGARAAAMGDAFTAVADDAAGMLWNPAGLSRIGSLNAVGTYGAIGNGISHSSVAGAYPLAAGTVAAGLSVLNFGDYDLRDVRGARIGSDGATDAAVVAAWGGRMPNWLGGKASAGVMVEGVRESVGGFLPAAGAGLQVEATPDLRLGASLGHLGVAGGVFPLPASLRLGGAYRLWFGRVAVDMGRELSGERMWLSSGMEASLHSQVTMRFGYRWRSADRALRGLVGLALGAGIRLGVVGVDYAYQPFGDLLTMHRVSLSYGLRPPGPRGAAAGGREAGPAGGMDVAARFRAATDRYAAGDYPAALAACRALLDADPEHWQGWMLEGNCRYASGDTPGALVAWRRSLEIHPANEALAAWVQRLSQPAAGPAGGTAPPAAASYERALAAYAGADHAAAIREAQAAVRADPGHWQAWQLLGNSRYALGDRAGALAAYDRSLAIHGDNPELRAWRDRVAGESQ